MKLLNHSQIKKVQLLYPRSTEGGMGVYWIHPDVCPSVRLSVRPSSVQILERFYLLHKQAVVQLDEGTLVAGGWHFIAATATKPPKAACQFAADDILLYEFCYYNPMDLLHHLGKDKEELSPLQYHIKFLQYQDITKEFAKKSNIPWIWRIIYGHKLPYMNKTGKKKQVCGAACFMAAEI